MTTTNWRITKLHTVEGDDVQISGLAVTSQGVFFTVYLDGLYRISSKNNTAECLVRDRDLENAEMCGIARGDGDLYACDLNSHRILSALNGPVCKLAGTGQEGHKDGNVKEAMFKYPEAIASDSNGNIYVSEYGYIRKINLKEGKVSTVAMLQPHLHRFGGIAVDKQGTIYGTDYFNHCIYQIRNGVISTLAGIPGKEGRLDRTLLQSKFSGPHGLACHKDGSLLVADKNGVRRIDIAKNRVCTLVPGINYLKDLSSLAIDKRGDIYVGTTASIYKLENTWELEKLLWIGYLKEDKKDCILAAIPLHIIQHIASYLRIPTLDQGEKPQISNKRARYG